MSALLEISDLRVEHAGKTTTALSVMRLLPPTLTQAGTITFRPPGGRAEINIGRRTERGMQLVRWRHISLVFQGAMNSLDPVQKVGAQIVRRWSCSSGSRPGDGSDPPTGGLLRPVTVGCR